MKTTKGHINEYEEKSKLRVGRKREDSWNKKYKKWQNNTQVKRSEIFIRQHKKPHYLETKGYIVGETANNRTGFFRYTQ